MLFFTGLVMEVHCHKPRDGRTSLPSPLPAYTAGQGQPCRSAVASQATPGVWCQGRGDARSLPPLTHRVDLGHLGPEAAPTPPWV